MPTDCIDELGPLPYQKVASSKDETCRLLLLAFNGYKPHVRSLSRFTNRLGIDRIIFMTLH
tara:strand:- start:3358 stop:3540 length:183 start_codon:yes stop_codon:yes gene_type:complete